MDLRTHLAVIWRFRLVMAGGLLLGGVLAVLASYQLSFGGGPLLVPRGTEEWTSTSRLLITQPGFPEGRTTLPNTVDPANPDAQPPRRGGIQFADPSRFSALAALYAVISYSDQVRDRVPERTKPGQIKAVPLDLNGSGQQFLPIVEITTKAETEHGARTLNIHTIKALRGLLTEQQDEAKIAPTSRVRAETLNYPNRAELTSGRSHAASVLALILAFAATLALAHILEGIRLRRHGTYAPSHPGEYAAEVLRTPYAGDPRDGDDRLIEPSSAAPPRDRPVSGGRPHGR